MGVWTVFSAVFGLILFGQGAFKCRCTAICCGGARIGFALLNVWFVSLALRNRQAVHLGPYCGSFIATIILSVLDRSLRTG
jgi:hypothetical protein